MQHTTDMMEPIRISDVEKIKKAALLDLGIVASAAALEEWRVKYLGRKGSVPQLLRQVKEVPAADRAAVGAAANSLRRDLEKQYQLMVGKQTQSVASKPEPSPPSFAKASDGAAPSPPSYEKGEGSHGAARSESHLLDGKLKATSYKLPARPGHLHPLTQTVRSLQAIMTSIGYSLVEGPLLEDTQHNFDNLNIGPEHPARAERDTFYVLGSVDPSNRRVLRTETSSVQVRAVQELGLTPPFKIFTLGRVFRNEKVDATHSHTFHQLEVLSIGPGVTVADFKGTVEALFSKFFGSEAKTRLRPHHFPFTEPSFEVDLQCVFCATGCHVCKGSRWIEIGGAGMVHPNVIRTMGLDPAEQQGFAWGFGVERLAMLKHGIDDVRLFLGNDLRFLRQF